MTTELIVRFFTGGALVALFALVGDAFKTKTFSGLFGAAPSVAIATLGLALHTKGTDYVKTEASPMLFACAALLAYAAACGVLAKKHKLPVWLGATLAYSVWLGIVLGGLEGGVVR